jgi:hypothetical protein
LPVEAGVTGDPGVASIPKSILRIHRGRAILLAGLAVSMMSGGALSGPQLPEERARYVAGLPAVSSSSSMAAEGWVERGLAQANPQLTPRDRGRIAAAIDRYSEQYELDKDLVIAVMLVESDARPWAHSEAGAVGLMQVMPHMMRPMGLAGNAATIESNIEAGCFILSHNIRRLGVERGISAYFWGSNIRGVAYLEKVLQARERVRGLRTS